MGDGVLTWILEADTVEGRLERIKEFLENEGYGLPRDPKGVDYSEAVRIDNIIGEPWRVKYSTVDKAGRKVYHYFENEVDHIMIRRIEREQEWAIQHISDIPVILKRGREIETVDKVSYLSRRRYLNPNDGRSYPARVIIKRVKDLWYVETFYIVE